MKKLSFCALLTAMTMSFCFGQQKSPAPTGGSPVLPSFVTSVEGVKEYHLSNGLQILLVPDAAQTNVVVNVVYHVGSRQEGYGETGMAHLLEHMMFKPSKKFTSIKQTIADKGAFANGTTFFDRTDYYEVLPATDSNLVWALDMESDRMVNSLMRNEDLQKEFSVVRNEFESGENDPSRILTERVLSTMYLWHNYGKSTIGSKEDIERVPIANLAAFYRRYYQPDDATLIVGGKFDEQRTLGLIEKYFAKIPKPARVLTQPYTVEPPQDGERYVELRRNGDVPTIGLAYHTPAYSDKDYVANEAVVSVLTNDPSGYFYKSLVETKLATNITSWVLTSYDPGFTYLSCSVPKDKSLDSAKGAFLTAANNLSNLVITPEDLDRAKNALKKQVSDIQNNTLSFCINLAEVIGAGDWRLFYIYRDRLDALTLTDVQAVLKKYYLPSNRTVGVFIPDKAAERVIVPDRPDVFALVKDYKGKTVKAQTETFESTIENIKKRTEYGSLPNGLKYALLKKPAKGDKIFANFIFKIGDENSLMGKNSIPMLTARMLKNGTTTKSKKEINDLLDKLKTSIEISGGNGDASTVQVSMLTDKENLNAALDVLADILLHPSFDKNEYDKMLIDINSELEANRSDPQYVASDAFNRKMYLYPKGHPLYNESIDEIVGDLKTGSPEDLKKFYNDFYGAGHAYVSFVGNFDAAVIKSFLEKNLGTFSSKQAYTIVVPKYFDVKGGVEVINIPDKKNATLFGGINMPLKESDPDYVALDMANLMLGGGGFLSSRIPTRLREKEGMSYGAGSFLSPTFRYPVCTWGVYAIFNPMYKNRLDSALKDEINKTLQEGFKADEYKKSVSGWLGTRKTVLGIDQYLASHLASCIEQGRDLAFESEYEEKVKNLSLDQVNAALRKYISADKVSFIYAGDFKK
jgi:zinc protease